ncbi:hypothetical protein JTB14_023344 [Gonioctena quinquepunctata]|nr:hypothetical protein JTB14_023344 [Gonioctena quinquepunctata]
MISENAECTLNASLSGTAKELFNRMLKRPGKQKTPIARHLLAECFILDPNLINKSIYEIHVYCRPFENFQMWG